jgi:hypothetical protein
MAIRQLEAGPLVVGLAECKAALRLDRDDEDAILAGHIRTAMALCEAFIGQWLITREAEQRLAADLAWQRLLAVPVLAGSAGYAVAEAMGWRGSLSARLDRGEGRGFYAVIAAATVGGVLLCFTHMDPVKELFWSAVLNGVIAVPIMAVMMMLATRRSTMGSHVVGPWLRVLGWAATGAMAAAVVAMLMTA